MIRRTRLANAPIADALKPGTTDATSHPSILWSLATGTTPRTITAAGWLTYAVLMILLAGQIFLPVVAQDEGQLLAYPWFMAHGLMLYRDIWAMYPPGTYIVLAALMKVGVPGLVAERGLSVGVHALYPLVINRACTGSWRRFSWLAVIPAFTFLFLVTFPDIRAYPWTLGVAVFAWALIVMRTRALLSAVLFLVAVSIRLELLAPAITALLVMSAFDVERRRLWIQALVGLSLTVTILLAILTTASSGAAFNQLVVDAFIRIPPGRSLPLDLLSLPKLIFPLEILTLAGPPLMACIGLVKHRPYLAASNVSVAMLSAHFLQRSEPGYLYGVSAIAIPWLVLSLIALAREGQVTGGTALARGKARLETLLLFVIGISTSGLALPMLVVYATLISPLIPGTPDSVSRFENRRITSGSNTIVATSSRVARDDAQVLRYLKLHETSSSHIYISPIGLRHAMWNMTSMYFLLQMRPGTRYLEMNPGVETRASIQREIIRGLRSTTWVLLWRGGFWYEPNASQRLGSALLARYIPAHYHVVLRNHTYELLRRV